MILATYFLRCRQESLEESPKFGTVSLNSDLHHEGTTVKCVQFGKKLVVAKLDAAICSAPGSCSFGRKDNDCYAFIELKLLGDIVQDGKRILCKGFVTPLNKFFNAV